MYRLHLDIVITRRKRYAMITDDSGETVWRSQFVGDCIEWLANESVDVYEIATSAAVYQVQMSRAVEPKE